MDFQYILDLLPYKRPFRFVDEISFIDENRIEGNYQYREDEFFYKGHFPEQPITPGAILTETMAQIGLVAFGIFLLLQNNPSIQIDKTKMPLLTSTNIHFYKKVLPEEKVMVTAEKIVFRHNKLRSRVSMKDLQNNIICDGDISGMFI